MAPRSEPRRRADVVVLASGIIGLLVVTLDSLRDGSYSSWSSAPLYVYGALAAFAATTVLRLQPHPTVGTTTWLSLAGLGVASTGMIVATGVGGLAAGLVALIAAVGLAADAAELAPKPLATLMRRVGL